LLGEGAPVTRPIRETGYAFDTDPAVLGGRLWPCGLGGVRGTFNASTSPSTLSNTCSGAPNVVNSSAPGSASVSCSQGGGAQTAAAHALPGQVGAMATVATLGGASGQASFTGIVRFTSAATGLTTVAFDLPLDGALSADVGTIPPGSPTYLASASIQAEMIFQSQVLFFSNTLTDDATGLHDSVHNQGFTVLSGDPAATSTTLVLQSPGVPVPLNTDLQFTFLVTAAVNATDIDGSARADFSHTFGFGPGISPFVLQDGVTATAGDYVVNTPSLAPARARRLQSRRPGRR
jgi:hypothetical protein